VGKKILFRWRITAVGTVIFAGSIMTPAGKIEVLVAAVIIGIIGGLLWLVGLRFQRAFHDTLDII